MYLEAACPAKSCSRRTKTGSPYNYTQNNPLSLIDKDGRATDPFAAYFQNQCNALWNTGVEFVTEFTFETLPVALDYVSTGTVLWAPEVAVVATTLSTGLTMSRDLNKNGALTTDSYVALGTFVVGSAKKKVIAQAASTIQLIYDETKDKYTDGSNASSEDATQAARDEKTKAALEELRKRSEEQKKKDEEAKRSEYSPVSTYR